MSPKESSDPEYTALQKEIESLKATLLSSQKAVRDAELDQVALSLSELPKLKLQTKRYLKGHIHKVNGVDFSGDSR
jgi:guanine nucleotide-binding protein subunit beta